MNLEGWFPLGSTGLISLQSKHPTKANTLGFTQAVIVFLFFFHAVSYLHIHTVTNLDTAPILIILFKWCQKVNCLIALPHSLSLIVYSPPCLLHTLMFITKSLKLFPFSLWSHYILSFHLTLVSISSPFLTFSFLEDTENSPRISYLALPWFLSVPRICCIPILDSQFCWLLSPTLMSQL